MRLETVLNAMIKAHGRINGVYGSVRQRQYYKFRDWIIRRDERLKTGLAIEKGQVDYWRGAYQLESKYNRED